MLDDIKDPDPSQFFQDDDEIETNIENPDSGFNANRNNKKFLGLKSQQLFILLMLLFLVVCLLGVMLLLVTGKIAPVFL
jgi:uncharacterized membrane protein